MSTAPALPSPCATRYRFRLIGHGSSYWRVVDSTGIRSGAVEAVHAGVEQLDFDTAIDLAQRFHEEADLAYTRRDRSAALQWETWADELERYAAAQRPPPGRVIRGSRGHVIIRRSHAVRDDEQPSFATMTRRDVR